MKVQEIIDESVWLGGDIDRSDLDKRKGKHRRRKKKKKQTTKAGKIGNIAKSPSSSPAPKKSLSPKTGPTISGALAGGGLSA